MKKLILKVLVNNLRIHPDHEDIYESSSTDSLKMSFLRTGNKPIYPPVLDLNQAA